MPIVAPSPEYDLMGLTGTNTPRKRGVVGT